MRSNSRTFSTNSIYMLKVVDFDPQGTIFEVRVHAGAKFGHTGCWSISKCSKSSRRNYTGRFRSWPPATCSFSTRRSLITMVKETVIYKSVSKKWKKMKLVRLSHWYDSDENAIDCEIACDCVKRANVVLGLCKVIFARKHTATHKLTSAQCLKVTTMTHIHTHDNRLWSP